MRKPTKHKQRRIAAVWGHSLAKIVVSRHLEASFCQLIHLKLKVGPILTPPNTAQKWWCYRPLTPWPVDRRRGASLPVKQGRRTCCSEVDASAMPVPPITCCRPETETCHGPVSGWWTGMGRVRRLTTLTVSGRGGRPFEGSGRAPGGWIGDGRHLAAFGPIIEGDLTRHGAETASVDATKHVAGEGPKLGLRAIEVGTLGAWMTGISLPEKA